MKINMKKGWKGLKIVFASYILALILWGFYTLATTGVFAFSLNLFWVLLAIATVFVSQHLI